MGLDEVGQRRREPDRIKLRDGLELLKPLRLRQSRFHKIFRAGQAAGLSVLRSFGLHHEERAHAQSRAERDLASMRQLRERALPRKPAPVERLGGVNWSGPVSAGPSVLALPRHTRGLFTHTTCRGKDDDTRRRARLRLIFETLRRKLGMRLITSRVGQHNLMCTAAICAYILDGVDSPSQGRWRFAANLEQQQWARRFQ